MSGYETDVFTWSAEQASLLRRRAAGELVNEASLDWEHIAEEIESVGRSQLSAVRSLLLQSLLHELKAQAWPGSRHVAHWRAEARLFRAQAAEAYLPSMRQHIDLPALHARAVRLLPAVNDGIAPGVVSQECGWSLPQLLALDD